MTREEAIERIKVWNLSLEHREVLAVIIPELAESEDERMFREIKRYLKEQGDKPTGLPNGTVAVSDMITWLEKQEEEEGYEAIPVESTLEYKLGFKAGKESEKQKEQKPADLSEMMVHKEPYIAPVPAPMVADERKPAECIDFYDEFYKVYTGPKNILAYVNIFVKKLGYVPIDIHELSACVYYVIKHIEEDTKAKQKEQKPAEWDEDTKTNLDRALQIIKKAKGTLQGYQSDDGIYECDKAIECLEHFLYRGLEIEKSVEWSEDYREEAIQTRFAFYTYKYDSSVLYLSNVFVEEASRNHGFGSRILKAAEKVAETIGATTICLKVKQDSPANAWYRKNGYNYVTFDAFDNEYDWLEKNLEYMKFSKPEWSEEDENKIERLAFLVSVAEEKEMISPSESIDLRNLIKSLRPRSKQEQQIKEGDKVSIHCRKDRREDITITYDGEVGEVIHVWDAKKHPWGHIIVQLNNGCNTGFYEDELEVLDESHWKPSEEQITAVKAAYSVLNSYDTWDEDEHLPTLMSLINDLQKLL